MSLIVRYLCCTILLFSGCVKQISDLPIYIKDKTLFEDLSPENLLEILKDRQYKSYTFDFILEDWISFEDVKKIYLLIGDKTPCSGVITSKSSKLFNEFSTVESEVAFIIEGYILGFYPSSMSSYVDSSNRIDRIKQWIAENEDLR